MPSRDEMLEFFKKFRNEVETKEGSPEDESKRLALESASILTRAERENASPARPVAPDEVAEVATPPPNGVVVRPPHSPNDSSNVRNRLLQIQASPKNKSPMQTQNIGKFLLPASQMSDRITLVLDVDETLVHSSFKPKGPCDLQLPIVVNGQQGSVFVRFRPYLHEFLNFVASRFEVVIFTASLGLYCNPLMDYLDPEGKLGKLRLFREHCSKANGAYIKDLSLLGRPLDRIAIVDNSPVAYYFQSRNAIPIVSWFDDDGDKELWELLPLLRNLAECQSVYDVLDHYNASIMS